MSATPDPTRLTMLAERARALAEAMQDGASRQAMLDVAATYDRLAQPAERLTSRAKAAGNGSE